MSNTHGFCVLVSLLYFNYNGADFLSSGDFHFQTECFLKNLFKTTGVLRVFECFLSLVELFFIIF